MLRTVAAVLSFLGANAWGQAPDLGEIHGNFELDAQYYREDTLIGAPDFPSELGSNSFMNLIYTRGLFEAGARIEAYYPAMQGFTREQGAGIPYQYARYKHEKFDITAGTFYEQFGSGMTLRSWESWGLGFDNSIYGFRLKSEPVKGVHLTGLIGRQRNAYSNKVEDLSDGLIRGFDGEWAINESFDSLSGAKTKVRIGGSFVSRYQKNEDPIINFPENVAAMAGRLNLSRGGLNIYGEYAYKINDPSTVHTTVGTVPIFKPGNAILLQASWSKKGIGTSLQFKRIDNMDFRSDRFATFNNLTLNYLPPQTKQHTYRLATLFPWATQALGEFAMQGEVFYNIKRDTPLGGHYGTNITLNVSRINALNKTPTTNPYDGYESEFVGKMDSVLFQDINIEISRKFSKKVKATLNLLHINYEQALFHQLTGFTSSENVTSDIQIVDISYKLMPKHTARVELQHAYTKQEFGSWAMVLVEYTIAPHYFIAVFDEYNYGNANPDKRIHYFSGTAGYNYGNYRFQIGYGRQRAGVLCVGGVCRVVPASNGVSLSITGSF